MRFGWGLTPSARVAVRLATGRYRLAGARCVPGGLAPDPESDHGNEHNDPDTDHPAHLDHLLILQVDGELGGSLLELGVEAREVEFVQLTQVGAVRSVHLIEPVYHLVGPLVAETVVEGLGEFRGHGHRQSPTKGLPIRYKVRSAGRGTKERDVGRLELAPEQLPEAVSGWPWTPTDTQRTPDGHLGRTPSSPEPSQPR